MHIDIKRACLLEIDVQNDFCPAYISMSGGEIPVGALAVNRGDEVIGLLNALSAAFAEAGGRVAASQDWHPCEHISFASSHEGRNVGELIELEAVKAQMLWPDHCVQGTRGAAFHEKLDLKPVSIVIRKGFRKGLDSYSAFFEHDRKTPTGLEGWLTSLGVTQLIIGGLATDYCVCYSVMDARALGFQTIIASDAARGVDYPAGSVEQAVETMKKSGVVFAESRELLAEMQK
jgi:nicotinamidase/pyrazinamidase